MFNMHFLIKQNQVVPPPHNSNFKYQGLIFGKLFSKEVYDDIQQKFMVKILSKLVRWELPRFDKQNPQ